MSTNERSFRTGILALSIVLGASACSDENAAAPTPAIDAGPKYEPMLTKDLVAPAARGLVLGVATEADVVAAFGAGETVKDKSLGGDAKVLADDAPAIRITLPAKGDVVRGEAWLVPDKSGTPRLHRLELVAKSSATCSWIQTNVGSVKGTSKRPGSNRKYGGQKGGYSYTAGSTDGTVAVGIECHPSVMDGVPIETLVYALEGENGTSLSVQPG